MLSAKVQSLVEELRSHKPHGATRKKKKKKKKKTEKKKKNNNYVCQNSSRSYSFIIHVYVLSLT